jgi:fucose permease
VPLTTDADSSLEPSPRRLSRDGGKQAGTGVAASDGNAAGGSRSMFVTSDGKSMLLTFTLVSSLFLLWGFCNGMIDVMDKHFQEELHLSLSQSAWVQFAHWMGYFLMALPAGWLATRLGYKGGIIAGLLLVAIGGFWFVPATKIAAFWAFLVGVCVVASGLTFLETVANPYTTVLGPPRYAATRINLAQSCNGVGWILGPIAGGLFFYAKDEAGRSTGAETLWIPYAGVAVVVLVLAVIFYFAPVPDLMTADEAAADRPADAPAPVFVRPADRSIVYALLLGNTAVLLGVLGMILWLVLGGLNLGPRLIGVAAVVPRPQGFVITAENSPAIVLAALGVLTIAVAAVALRPVVSRLSPTSIWAHEHFSGATLAQFFYVAAQAGIFSFLINYMTSQPPGLPASWFNQDTAQWIEIRTEFAGSDFASLPALAAKLRDRADPVSAHLADNLSAETHRTLERHADGLASETTLRVALMQDLNALIRRQSLYNADRFEGVALRESTLALLAQSAGARDEARLNRLLLADAFPGELRFRDNVLSFTNQAAANLASFGFICFLLGRVSGAALLRRFSAHKVVGLYGVLNVAACFLVFLKLGWVSVVSVFLSYFFMSIMFPTIFALGIFGLGPRAKQASAYIVMGIVGGAILPKVMGAVADSYDMSRGFIVPMVCFALIACYGYAWPRLSRARSLGGVGLAGSH